MVKHTIYSVKIGESVIELKPPVEWVGEEGETPDYWQLVEDAGYKFFVEDESEIKIKTVWVTGFVEI